MLHKKLGLGYCDTCGHYGADCTGTLTETAARIKADISQMAHDENYLDAIVGYDVNRKTWDLVYGLGRNDSAVGFNESKYAAILELMAAHYNWTTFQLRKAADAGELSKQPAAIDNRQTFVFDVTGSIFGSVSVKAESRAAALAELREESHAYISDGLAEIRDNVPIVWLTDFKAEDQTEKAPDGICRPANSDSQLRAYDEKIAAIQAAKAKQPAADQPDTEQLQADQAIERISMMFPEGFTGEQILFAVSAGLDMYAGFIEDNAETPSAEDLGKIVADVHRIGSEAYKLGERMAALEAAAFPVSEPEPKTLAEKAVEMRDTDFIKTREDYSLLDLAVKSQSWINNDGADRIHVLYAEFTGSK